MDLNSQSLPFEPEESPLEMEQFDDLLISDSQIDGLAAQNNRFEAEALNLDGYRIENNADDAISGNALISLNQAGIETGKADGIFTGATGLYQVEVGYFDENDGASNTNVTVDGNSQSWQFDRDLKR